MNPISPNRAAPQPEATLDVTYTEDSAGGGTAPSARFLEVVHEIGHELGLDGQWLAQGAPVLVQTPGPRPAIQLRFVQYGALDPNGLTVLITLCHVHRDTPAALLRRLLGFNAMTPAAVTGYCALLDEDMLVYGRRFDIERTDAAALILQEVDALVQEGQQIRDQFCSTEPRFFY